MLTERLSKVQIELSDKFKKTEAETKLLNLIDQLHNVEENIISLNAIKENQELTLSIIMPHADRCNLCGRTLKK